jgi:O-antigen ligase
VGWGWVSYWFPFVEPFTDLAERNGVVYLQAHDAYLDVWFQLGWIGLALFGLTIVGVVLRSWWWAVDRRMLSRGVAAPWSALDLLPLLLVTALLVHGLTESRLIVEWGWATFVVVVLVTRRDPFGWTGHDR